MTALLPIFRQIGGIGNNQDASLEPTAGSPELAITSPNFAGGSGNDLIDGTNPRTISNMVAGAVDDPTASSDTADPTYSAWLYTFGQFVDHDLDLEKVSDTDISIPVPNGD